MNADTTTYDATLARARAAGEDHGRSAASWYFDWGRMAGGRDAERTHAQHVLQGIEDGDPEVMDTFPSSPLSGEWADSPTPATVLSDLDVSEDDDAADDILAAYEDGFYTASSAAIEDEARRYSSDDD